MQILARNKWDTSWSELNLELEAFCILGTLSLSVPPNNHVKKMLIDVRKELVQVGARHKEAQVVYHLVQVKFPTGKWTFSAF